MNENKWANGNRFYGVVVIMLGFLAAASLSGYIFLQFKHVMTGVETLGTVLTTIVGGLIGVVSSPRGSKRLTDDAKP